MNKIKEEAMKEGGGGGGDEEREETKRGRRAYLDSMDLKKKAQVWFLGTEDAEETEQPTKREREET